MASKGGLKNIVIFLGSVRPGRMVDRVHKYVKGIVEGQKMNPITMDPKVMPFEVCAVPLHFMPKPEAAPTWMKEAHETIKAADGFIVISGEYNSTLPPALTNMMDHFPPTSFQHRPVGIITYSVGPFGGARSLVHLRPFVCEFGMIVMPTPVTIPSVQNALADDGKCQNEMTSKTVLKMVQQVKWYADAIKAATAISPPPPYRD